MADRQVIFAETVIYSKPTTKFFIVIDFVTLFLSFTRFYPSICHVLVICVFCV